MLKTITTAAAAGALTALLTVGASALPLAPLKQPGAESNLILVRDGCGRGMRYSNSRDRCVSKSSRGRHHGGSRWSDHGGSRWSDRGRHQRHYRNDEDIGSAIVHGLFGGGRSHW